MYGHYLLKLIANLAQVRKTLLYSNIFMRKFCTLLNVRYICTYGCSFVYGKYYELIITKIVLPELFEESH